MCCTEHIHEFPQSLQNMLEYCIRIISTKYPA